LRGSLGSLLKGAARARERGGQPPLDIQQHPAGIGDRRGRLGHEVPRHLVEELLDVEIDRPVVLPAPLPACRERVMGRLARPVAIGVGVKPVVRPFLQVHGHHRLRDPVGDRRHATRERTPLDARSLTARQQLPQRIIDEFGVGVVEPAAGEVAEDANAPASATFHINSSRNVGWNVA
jgi:hypothetical protein